MTYIKNLDSNQKEYKKVIDHLVSKYKIQIVGSGYIDLITPSESAKEFIHEITQHKLILMAVSWWCHCTDENEKKYGCPHGYGGPRSEHSTGWFSEMGIKVFEVLDEILSFANENPTEENIKEINASVLHAVSTIDQNEAYSPCLVPAFWLYVPNNWSSMNSKI